MSDEKFIERSMYGGKGDKNPKKPLIIAILIAIFVIGVGILLVGSKKEELLR